MPTPNPKTPRAARPLTRRQAIQTTLMTTLALATRPNAANASIDAAPDPATPLRLWYRQPAPDWLHALPIGNGRLGAMVFGGIETEKLQLNEATVWAGGPHDYTHPDAHTALPEIRRLIFAGEWAAAQKLINDRFMGLPLRQLAYQTVGNLILDFAPTTTTSSSPSLLPRESTRGRTGEGAGGWESVKCSQ